MKEDFSNIFQASSSCQFSKLPLSTVKNVLNVNIMGLHNIKNASIVKEHNLHSHSFAELHYSLNGYALYKFSDDTQFKLEKGMWLLIPISFPHKIIEYSDNYVKYSCSFQLNDSIKDDMAYSAVHSCLEAIINDSEIRSGNISNSAAKCIKFIHSKVFDKHALSVMMVKSPTESVLLDTLSPLLQKIHYSTIQGKDMRFEIAVQFIKDNIYNRIDCGDVARKVYLSIRQTDRMFQKKLFVTVSEFILEQKCEVAKQMLISSDLSVITISEKLSFTDPAYFSRFFKKRVGVSPQKFRLENQSNTK